MTFNIYSFQDPKAGCFGSLMVKIENPKDMVEQISRQLRKNPNDDLQNYVLWHLGTFDDSEGVVTSVGVKVVSIKDLVPKQEVKADASN